MRLKVILLALVFVAILNSGLVRGQHEDNADEEYDQETEHNDDVIEVGDDETEQIADEEEPVADPVEEDPPPEPEPEPEPEPVPVQDEIISDPNVEELEPSEKSDLEGPKLGPKMRSGNYWYDEDYYYGNQELGGVGADANYNWGRLLIHLDSSQFIHGISNMRINRDSGVNNSSWE